MTADAHPDPDVTAGRLPMPHVPDVAHRMVRADDGCRLHVAEAGAGDPLILIHGWPQHWYVWRDVIGALAMDFHVICPDVRGLGWSDTTGDDWSLRRLARDVTCVMDAFGIDRAGIVGHDWGSAIAYRLGVDRPDRVTGLMPVAGVHPWTSIGIRPRGVWRPWHVYTAAVSGRLNNTWMRVPEVALDTWRHVGRFTPVEIEIYCGSVRQPHAVRATTQYYRGILTHEVPHLLRGAADIAMSMPICHVNGADDPLTQQLSGSWRDHAPNMTLINLPSCGHFVAEERPERLVAHATAFFGDHR